MSERVKTSCARHSGHRAMRLVGVIGLAATALSLGGCVTEVQTASTGAAPGYGYTCYAGVYVCRIPQQIAVGTQCSCPGIGAPSFGTVR